MEIYVVDPDFLAKMASIIYLMYSCWQGKFSLQ